MNLGKKSTEEAKDVRKEVKEEVSGHKKVSVTKEAEIEKQTDPWISPLYPVEGKHVRVSAWMKAKDLYYRDLSFVLQFGVTLEEDPRRQQQTRQASVFQ